MNPIPNQIPAIISGINPDNSISTIRALKHIRRCLLDLVPDEIANSEDHNAEWNIAIQEIEFMMDAVKS